MKIKPILFILLLIALQYRAISQSFMLNNKDSLIIDYINKYNENINVKYFVYIDKFDCFNCTLSSSLIKQELDSEKVYIISNQIPINVRDEFINYYGLSKGYNYIENEILLNFFKEKSLKIFKDKSFIVEANSVFITIIPLKKFKDKTSFSQINNSKNEKIIYNKGNFISAITKFNKLNDDYIAMLSPKNTLNYFSKDTLRGEIKLDSNFLKPAYNYLISQYPDSIQQINSYQKCIETYNTQIKRIGLPIMTPQNLIIKNENCIVVTQIAFPIWEPKNTISYTSKLFLLKLKNLEPISIYPINTSDLPRGKTMFAYNLFSFNFIDSSFIIGFYMDSVLIKDKSLNYINCKYSLSKGIYFQTNEKQKIPNKVIDEYLNLQNLALIHYQVDSNTFYYKYLPLLSINNHSAFLFNYQSKYTSYHNYASIKSKVNFIDLCSVNGINYIIKYKIINNNIEIDKLLRIDTGCLLQSAVVAGNGFEYIGEKNGIFYRGIIDIY
ncbi:MAG: hypothetical protein HUU47_01880 [Bacteroidetes bacterium]|nr:hypothetical protein [Bacteroidota bacterium]